MTADATGSPDGIAAEADSAHNYWRRAVAPYERASWWAATIGVLTSVVPYIALTVGMYLLFDVSIWLTLALAIPAAGFLLRTFIVFHDCTHGSYLPTKRGNRRLGRITGLIVFQPFANWGHNHAVHHGTTGDLGRRGQGDIETLTVAEYEARSWRGRLAYRLFRNPGVLLGIGPIWAMMIGPRLWSRKMRPRQIHSVWLTNIALLALTGVLIWVVGPLPWLVVTMSTWILAGTAGVFLFYVQHQFEDAYWETGEKLGLRGRRAEGQLLPEAAEVLPVLHRQHRPPPRPPPERQDPQLQPAARPRRDPDLRRRPGPHLRRGGPLPAAEARRPRRGPAGHLEAGAGAVRRSARRPTAASLSNDLPRHCHRFTCRGAESRAVPHLRRKR